MATAQRIDDNPCRPRHFKPPPPCAPVVADERANQVLETCRTRLVATAALFAVVFLVVVLRLSEIVLLSGGSAESHIGRLPPAAPPPPARADIVDRNGALLATMLPKPSLFVNSKALIAAGQNPDEAAYELASVLSDKSPGEIRARLVSGKSFVYLQRSLTPRQQYAVNRLGIPGLDFTPEERRYAKVINFGLIYGMSAFGLAQQLGLERATAQAYIASYFTRYPAVAKYMEETRKTARERGYVETVFGRRLWLPEIKSSNPARRGGAERAAINAPMQGTAADLIKLAMIAVRGWLDRERLSTKLIMQVHDELVLEAPDAELDRVRAEIPELMSGVAKLKVPLVVDVGSGQNWEKAH